MHRRTLALTVCLGLLLLFGSGAALAQYKVTNLVSNQVAWANHIDPLSVNAWGLVHTPTSPFWVSDAGSGWSTLYTGTGAKRSLIVEVPPAHDAGVGSPTGIVFNLSPEFQVGGWASIFIFDTLDGTISGWAPQTNVNNSVIAVDNSAAKAVYTGLAITSKASGNMLYAADVANNKVDIYDGSWTWVKSFTDSTLPAGFAPFGIQDIGGLVYVAFADTALGPGGFIDIFSEDGTFIRRFAEGAPLNQPWGFAVAPANFGPLSNTILISNNTNSGTINGFSPTTGQFVGAIKDTNGKVIHIDQLWGIEFGGGTANNGGTNQLFFTAGPHNNLTGLFGKIGFQK